MSELRVVLAIPCYNEAGRFRHEELERFLADPRMHLLLVDDGSTDATGEILARFCEDRGGRAQLLSLSQNRGKGEAVRAALRRALASGADAAGYADADLATPVDEVLRLVDVLEVSTAAAVIGSRVAHLGADIRRRATRHYVARVFATAASLILREPVYDTQCGAKLFRATDVLGEVLARPFRSRWAFDVELLGRLMASNQRVIEVPLRRWDDVPGSKLRLSDMARTAVDLVRIARDLRGRPKPDRA